MYATFGANSCKKSSSFWVEHISNAIFMLLHLILPHRIIIYADSNSMTWRIKSVSFCRFAQKAVLQNAMECPPPLAVHSNLIIQTTSWLLQFSCKLLLGLFWNFSQPNPLEKQTPFKWTYFDGQFYSDDDPTLLSVFWCKENRFCSCCACPASSCCQMLVLLANLS